jgi:TolB-like protein/DNA-binding winged helix-turn-helix (wHTH) protein
MPDLAEPVLYRFDDFLLDRQAGTLTRQRPDGQQTSVEIGSRAFQILCLLVDRRGQIVSQRELMDAVWPNVAVEPNNLTVQLSALRRVLDDDRKQGSCIRNVPGRGYRFMPTVTETSGPLRSAGAVARADDHQDADAVAGPTSRLLVGTWRGHAAWMALSLVLVAVLLSVAWYPIRTSSPPAETAAAATATPAERPRLSLVVLPFGNLGGDGLADDTVDGITQDLTTDISLVPGSTVITRNTAFTYKGKPIDVKRVGEELGVRYAVEGNVRKLDGSLRVNVQLVSTETGTHLWAERFNVRRDGIGYGVDDIVRQIAFTLNVRIVDTEAARNLRERPSNPDVADILLRARSLYNRPPTPQRQAELVPLYERALELDPSSATALAGLAEAQLDSIGNPFVDLSAPEKFRRAEELLKRAELLRPDDIMVMWVRVYLLGRQNRCPETIAAAQREVDAYPNATGARQWRGICLMRLGRVAEAVPELERAIRIAPRNPEIGTRYRWMGYLLLFLERYDEAVASFERSLAANPGDDAGNRGDTYAAIAAAQALAGRGEQAHLSAAEVSRLRPRSRCKASSPTASRTPSLSPRSPACAMACGWPASAITPTRMQIPGCHPTAFCTQNTRLPPLSPRRERGPFGPQTWPGWWNSASRWYSTLSTGAGRFLAPSGCGAPASAAACLTSFRIGLPGRCSSSPGVIEHCPSSRWGSTPSATRVAISRCVSWPSATPKSTGIAAGAKPGRWRGYLRPNSRCRTGDDLARRSRSSPVHKDPDLPAVRVSS